MTRVAVLLGAGASKEADLPVSVEMTDALVRSLTSVMEPGQFPQRAEAHLFDFVVHSLHTLAASRGDSTGVDVETVFASIEALGDRRDLPVFPFVAAWHPFVVAAERTASGDALRTHDLERLFDEAVGTRINAAIGPTTASGFATRHFISALTGRSDEDGRAFRNLQATVLSRLARILQLGNPEKVRYLSPLGDLYAKQGGLSIATLNYDLSVETLGELLHIHVDTGMDQWHLTERLEFAPGVQLLKLHGSIDWQTTRGAQPPAPEPLIRVNGIERTPFRVAQYPALIFGAGNKLRAGGPFLELLRIFGEELSSASALVVVGYSFRDEHVNAVITSWLNGKESRRLLILDPSVERFGPILQYSQPGLARQLAVLVNQRPARVQHIQQTAAGGLSTAIEAAQN